MAILTYSTATGTVYAYNNTANTVTIYNRSGTSGVEGTQQYSVTPTTVTTANTTTPISVVGALIFSPVDVLVPGATASYTVANVAGTSTLYIGGTATISQTSILGTTNIYADGGNVTLANGVGSALSGTNIFISNGGTFSGGSALVSALSGTTIAFGTNGGTFVANTAPSVLSFLNGITITGYNPATDVIQFNNLSAAPLSYNIAGTGTTRTVTLYSGANEGGVELGTYTVTIATGVTMAAGNYAAGTGPLSLSYTNGTLDVGTCFLAGSMIETPDGSVAVEDIHVGDSVVAYVDGVAEVRNVIWTGTKHVTVNPALPADEAGYPVRIRKDAIADGMPNKDLLVTAEHCLFVDGKFVPARMHVNGSSIAYDRSITSYDYFHVETADHAVIKANNVLTESYLDTGNRTEMRQEGNVVRLGGSPVKTWEKDGAAPLCVDRAIVEPLFQRLAARAEALGLESVEPAPELTTDPNLHLVTKTGRVLRKTRDANGFAMFMIPAGVEDVWVVSRASRPSDVVGPFLDDRRNLGVLVGDVVMFDSGTSKQVDSHLTTDLEGWNNREQGNVRWTSGRAYLALGRRRPDAIGMLGLKIMAAGPYLVETEVAVATVANSDV